jgi:hypothetical protein
VAVSLRPQLPAMMALNAGRAANMSTRNVLAAALQALDRYVTQRSSTKMLHNSVQRVLPTVRVLKLAPH